MYHQNNLVVNNYLLDTAVTTPQYGDPQLYSGDDHVAPSPITGADVHQYHLGGTTVSQP